MSISSWLSALCKLSHVDLTNQNSYCKTLGVSLVKFACDKLHIVDNQPEIDDNGFLCIV